MSPSHRQGRRELHLKLPARTPSAARRGFGAGRPTGRICGVWRTTLPRGGASPSSPSGRLVTSPGGRTAQSCSTESLPGSWRRGEQTPGRMHPNMRSRSRTLMMPCGTGGRASPCCLGWTPVATAPTDTSAATSRPWIGSTLRRTPWALRLRTSTATGAASSSSSRQRRGRWRSKVGVV